MIKFFLCIAGILLIQQDGFYSLRCNQLTGESIDFANFKGKKVLVVNVASQSDRATEQMEGLRKLAGLFGDSIRILAFPSNSFGKEDANGQALAARFGKLEAPNTMIMEKAEVKGANAHPVYQWLCRRDENKEVDIPIKDDFQKILINDDGRIVGIFSGKLLPTDARLLAAVRKAYDF